MFEAAVATGVAAEYEYAATGATGANGVIAGAAGACV